MPLVVQKYGGTSVGTAERIRAVAERVRRTRESGYEVVVVVSAMGDTTDRLVELARSVAPEPDRRDYDLLLSTGETQSTALLSMALKAIGCPSISLAGAQLGIKTDRVYSRARIMDIQPDRLKAELANGRCVIVPGFQGVTDEGDITTIGRGGSDTTAVALACALEAPKCEIYTDVDGVFTADPRIVPTARRLSSISYEEMLELAQMGARVMHPRAVELAELYSLLVEVRSSFNDHPGTLIDRGDAMESRKHVRGIAHDTNVAKVTLAGVPDCPGLAHALFAPLAEAGISVDVIVQAASIGGLAEISFTVSRADLNQAMQVVEKIAAETGASVAHGTASLAKISIVGTGLQSAPGYAARMFGTLAEHGINIDMITTSDIRITCVIEESAVEEAVQALHTTFELDKED
ncbi:MAG: aspartate kinase [Chloroflexi bacterium]|nr:aspartate kinase [Chloroflexota bacterium]